MKINFDIECTPEEARAFLGLPNVAPMQDRMMKEMEARLLENIRNLDPETLVNTWMPMTLQGWNDMQKSFWAQMTQMGGSMPGFGSGAPSTPDAAPGSDLDAAQKAGKNTPKK